MNTFGNIFRFHIFGESHGKAVGVVIDGCPPGIEISETDFLADLKRRKSGARGTTKRIEPDKPQIISGVFNGTTTGSPITIIFENTNTRAKDYKEFENMPRPGHADFVAKVKYKGFNDERGGGHFSGRLTLGIVATGVIAKKILKNIEIKANLLEVGGNKNIEQAIENAIQKKDSIGGIIECRVKNVPIGLGEPFFDSIESKISHLIFSIPAINGIEFGSGFASGKLFGSQCNDIIKNKTGLTQTNHAGGINGGISNGNDIYFRVVVKPTSSIGIVQKTYNFKTKKKESLIIKGRHDVCIALRVPVIIEAATAIVLCDLAYF